MDIKKELKNAGEGTITVILAVAMVAAGAAGAGVVWGIIRLSTMAAS